MKQVAAVNSLLYSCSADELDLSKLLEGVIIIRDYITGVL